jgi:hypothetical protein
MVMKTTIFILSVLVLSACATAPEHRTAVLTVATSDARDELECVGKCLEFGDETCESCVDRCMDAPPSAAVAVFGRDSVNAPTAR